MALQKTITTISNSYIGGATRRVRRGRAPQGAFAFIAPARPEVVSHTHHAAGVSVFVGRGYGVLRVKVLAHQPRHGAVMHWAVDEWQAPPVAVLPPGTVPTRDTAVQTPFQGGESVTITFQENEAPEQLVFVLKEGEQWTNDSGRDFVAPLKPTVAEAAPIADLPTEPTLLACTHYDNAGIWVFVAKDADGAYQVKITADEPQPGRVLRWAVGDWELPPAAALPPATRKVDKGAVETPFFSGESVIITFPEDEVPEKLVFVVREGNSNSWVHCDGGDFTAYLTPPSIVSSMDEGDAASSGAYQVVVTGDEPWPELAAWV